MTNENGFEGMTDEENLSDAQREAWCLLVELMVLEGKGSVLSVIIEFYIYREEYLRRRKENRNKPS